MFYVFHGSDIQKARERVHTLLESKLAQKPNAIVVWITDENIEEHNIVALTEGQALFEQRYFVVFDHLLNTEHQKTVTDFVKECAASENIFFILEEYLDTKTKKLLEMHAEKLQEFQGKEKKPEATAFNRFSLTDALGTRDSRKLWVLYHRARQENVSDEEIHGILFWQAKSMLLAQSAKSAQEAGMKEYPYKKSLRFAKNYTEEELQKLSSTLVTLNHDARRGTHEFSIALEQFALTLSRKHVAL